MVGWTERSIVAIEMERALYLLWQRRKKKKFAMDGFEEQLEDEVRKDPHLYDSSLRYFKDGRKTSNSCGERASKSRLIPLAPLYCGLSVFHLLLLLHGKIKT